MLRARRIRSLAALLLAGPACLVLSGCGGGPDLPPLAEVSGTVTLDDKPLPRGMVQFVPDKSKGTTGAPAVGNIDSQGRYTLRTAGVEGAVIGHHKVRVEARQEPKDETDSMPPSLIPQRYQNPETSGLAFEVKAGQDNQIDLKLTSRP